MSAIVGRTGKVTLGSTKILGLGIWSYSALDADVFEDSEFGDTYKTYKVALKEGGTISFDGYYDPADSTGQTQLKTYWQNATDVTSLRLYHDANSYWGCFAIDEQCNSIASWQDEDTSPTLGASNAASTQESNPLGGSLETFKFTVTTAEVGAHARRSRNYGDIFSGDTRVDLKLYCDEIDTLSNVDYFELIIHLTNNVGFRARFASDGLYINNGSSDVEVGTNLVSEDTWQTWRFDIRHGDDASAVTCDVYRGGTLQSSGVDCSWTEGAADDFGFDEDRMGFDGDEFGLGTTFTEGYVQLTQYGENTNSVISYVDYLRVQTGYINVTNWEVSADKSALEATNFSGKVTGRLALV